MLTVADTAFAIAAVRAEETDLPAGERLFEDPVASIFARAGAHPAEGTKRFFELPWFRTAVRLRTRFFDDFVREGLRAGLDQLVILGAGFDCRGLRLPEIAARDATVFEVDFAAQLERKRSLLLESAVTGLERIESVGCDFMASDFEEALPAALARHGFRAGAGAMFVWEGVVPYIGLVAIDRSLRVMARTGGGESAVAFDFGHELFAPDTAEAAARRAGFTVFEDVGCDELWRRYLSDEPPPLLSVMRFGVARVRDVRGE